MKTISNIEEIRKNMIGMKNNDGPITEKVIERKAGIKLNMASLIIDLTNASTSASEILVTRPEYLLAR